MYSLDLPIKTSEPPEWHQQALVQKQAQAQEWLEVVESRLRHKALLGTQARGKDRCHLVLEKVQAGIKEVRTSRKHAGGVDKVGAQAGLEWHLEGRATVHSLDKQHEFTCSLCAGRGTMKHILGSWGRPLPIGS